MKNKTLVNLVLLILLLGTLNVQAQNNGNNDRNKIVFSNWVNPMNMQTIDFENIMTVILFPESILKVNLVATTARTQDIDQYPDMYIQYAFGVHSGVVGPIVQADFSTITLENGEAGMEARFLEIFEYANECSNADKYDMFDLPVSFSLVGLKNGVYSPYPVLDCPGLFPPDWFQESTLPFPLPEFSDIKHIDCVGLTAGGGGFNGSSSAQDNDQVDLSLQPAGVQPNPFVDDLQVVYQLHKPSTIDINVLDAYGRLLFSQTTSRKDAGKYRELLALSDLVPGLYYLQLKSEGSRQIIKVIKN